MKTIFAILISLIAQTWASDIPEIGEPLSMNTTWRLIPTAKSTICLGQINQQRSNNGRHHVQDHSQVEQAAYNHNRHMMDTNCFSHDCPGEPGLGQRLSDTGYRWSGVGEIIAKGQRDCNAAVEAWMNSQGHRDIMLDNYRHVGCSGLTCSNCRDPGPWWTCVFANPM